MNKPVFLALFAVLLFSSGLGAQQAEAVTTVKLKHLGVLQVAAHDLFDVDRTTETDFENGLLDLSTLLRNMRGDGSLFPDAQIELGGEFRNAENVMIFTTASELGTMYVTEKNKPGGTHAQAKAIVLAEYYDRLEEAYVAAFGEEIPEPGYGCTTMEENLALRTIHDFLPETIDLEVGGVTNIFEIPFFTVLTTDEQNSDSSPLDGEFDMAFAQDTMIPALGITLNLLEKDQTFGEQFNIPPSSVLFEFEFDFFLSELENESYDADDEVMKLIRTLFAKGYGEGCYVGGEFIPIESTSLLLAGTQMTASWMIPILVSGIGIGLVFLRKN